jgi:hypothetical protein
MALPPAGEIVVSRDGRDAIHLIEYEEHDALMGSEHRDAVALYFTVRLVPKSEVTRLRVVVSGYFWKHFKPTWYQLGDVDRGQAILQLALYAIGRHLENLGMPSPIPSGVPAFTIELNDQELGESRSPASDEEVFNYIAGKVYWSWRFGIARTEFTLADRLRLAVPEGDIERVAMRGELVYWGSFGVAPRAGERFSHTTFTPTAALLNDFEAGRLPGQSVSPVFQVQDRLSAPRYSAAKAHFSKAASYMGGPRPDWPNAAKEAVTAVESLAKVITGRSSETLGDLIKHLRSVGKLPPPMDKMFEGLWGFANSAPGVRHGGTTPPSLSEAEATFVVNSSASAILYLLNIDR